MVVRGNNGHTVGVVDFSLLCAALCSLNHSPQALEVQAGLAPGTVHTSGLFTIAAAHKVLSTHCIRREAI